MPCETQTLGARVNNHRKTIDLVLSTEGYCGLTNTVYMRWDDIKLVHRDTRTNGRPRRRTNAVTKTNAEHGPYSPNRQPSQLLPTNLLPHRLLDLTACLRHLSRRGGTGRSIGTILRCLGNALRQLKGEVFLLDAELHLELCEPRLAILVDVASFLTNVETRIHVA